MSNPFRKTSALKRLFAILVLVAFNFSFSPVAMAQDDFDFSDDGSDASYGGGDDFNFADDTSSESMSEEEKFEMPNNGKPVNLVFFEPVDSTQQRILDQLTEATIDALQAEQYANYDSVEAIPVVQKLDTMDADSRITCIDDAACMAEIGKEIGAANILIGRIYTEGRDRPQISLDLIDVETASNKNSIYFDTQERRSKQRQDIKGALLRLFNIDTGSIDSLLTKREVVEAPPLPLGQMVSGIVIGVIALGAIGTGIYFGVEAGNYDDKVKDAIKANRDPSTVPEGSTIPNQKKTKEYYDKGSDYAMVANILFATGAVAAVVSVILFLVRSDKDDDIFSTNDLYISPSVGTDGGGVVAGFSF